MSDWKYLRRVNETCLVLIRRLFEGGDESGLASGILSTLDIE